jgi:hypothetical protein
VAIIYRRHYLRVLIIIQTLKREQVRKALVTFICSILVGTGITVYHSESRTLNICFLGPEVMLILYTEKRFQYLLLNMQGQELFNVRLSVDHLLFSIR